jgi:hypothetical protein
MAVLRWPPPARLKPTSAKVKKPLGKLRGIGQVELR